MKTHLSLAEVSRMVGVKPYILKYWESEMDLNPKRVGRRRYYSPGDVKTIVVLSDLLRNRDMSLREARKAIREQGLEGFLPLAFRTLFREMRSEIGAVLEEIRGLRSALEGRGR
jgi:DNA-binding transcriptional MerR regulator